MQQTDNAKVAELETKIAYLEAVIAKSPSSNSDEKDEELDFLLVEIDELKEENRKLSEERDTIKGKMKELVYHNENLIEERSGLQHEVETLQDDVKYYLEQIEASSRLVLHHLCLYVAIFKCFID